MHTPIQPTLNGQPLELQRHVQHGWVIEATSLVHVFGLDAERTPTFLASLAHRPGVFWDAGDGTRPARLWVTRAEVHQLCRARASVGAAPAPERLCLT